MQNSDRTFTADVNLTSQGVNIRRNLDDQLEKSVAFPSSIALASTWNKELAGTYAKSIGEECRAGEIAILLGPGINIYRVSQNGRNFEYLGELSFWQGQDWSGVSSQTFRPHEHVAEPAWCFHQV